MSVIFENLFCFSKKQREDEQYKYALICFIVTVTRIICILCSYLDSSCQRFELPDPDPPQHPKKSRDLSYDFRNRVKFGG